MRLRELTYLLLEDEERRSTASILCRTGLLVLIVVSVAATIAETMPDLDPTQLELLLQVEAVSMMIFVVEYLLRVWVAVEDRAGRYTAPVTGRLRYMVTPSALVDLVAILPFVLGFVIGGDLVFLRLLRILRILKVTRYAPALQTLELVFYNERRSLFSAFVVVGVVVILAAGFMYLAEGKAQPDKFGSLPMAIYWAMITVTTVGYGDTYPITNLGKIVAAITAIFGIGTLALPTAIVGAGLIRELQKQDFLARASVVARVPVFRHLPPAQLAEITTLLQLRILPPRYTVIRHGEHPEAMYFIDQGRVVLRHGDRRVTLGAGAFFGELALLEGRPREVTVVTLTSCRLLELGAGDFHRLIGGDAQLRHILLGEARERHDAASSAAPEPTAPT